MLHEAPDREQHFPVLMPVALASVRSGSECYRSTVIVEQGLKTSMEKSKDQDRGKGAMEEDPQNHGGNTSMPGQLGHRDEDPQLKDADSDLSG